jgi:hypothetical protein
VAFDEGVAFLEDVVAIVQKTESCPTGEGLVLVLLDTTDGANRRSFACDDLPPEAAVQAIRPSGPHREPSSFKEHASSLPSADRRCCSSNANQAAPPAASLLAVGQGRARRVVSAQLPPGHQDQHASQEIRSKSPG